MMLARSCPIIFLLAVLGTATVNAFSGGSYSSHLLSNPVTSAVGRFPVQQQARCPNRALSLRMMSSFEDDILQRMKAVAPPAREALKNQPMKEGQMFAGQQWNRFRDATLGRWQGIWQTYDIMGDMQDERFCGVEVDSNGHPGEGEVLVLSNVVQVGSVKSDCPTCFDSTDFKRLPVATFNWPSIARHLVVGDGYMNGPSVLRNGAMSSEICLRHGDGRLRVTVQHAPVWEKDSEQIGPPDALKVFRVIVAREALRESPPTREAEAANPPGEGNACFWRPVSPFKWHAVWRGTSRTFGKTQGEQGWAIPELEEQDAWHGRPRGDQPNVWTLRLPGGVLVQAPTLVRPGETEQLRVAWLPEDSVLLRADARMVALKEADPEPEDEGVVRLLPPECIFFSVDNFQRAGDLPEVPVLVDEEEFLKMGEPKK
mmetsp:Transcript_23364/g.55700  ORF Transcript_23364/g.55700 Transcript_23364/m.55700 type:complete len:428 (-) Transcript_23364:164-1447(-)|eukprot:CAMPEP_0177708216 /NCGR_PEP_ID=MMETSP0484_2-20121128/10163_1 /TAXON_ID=354590 /ORGANISM="Rhodomonas lens, Strain RHODO" /LENGTH=427 /DNA_ID=CAMNT_0019219775 /DNA_START=65 /DNA_END=1348 /DNA_ORIENTATION=+